MRNESGKKIFAGAYALAFLALLAFLLWKCRYGYANIDEAFYLTIPYRLCRGDSLLLHEWHLSQLSGFLLYPAVKLYLLLFGNTEGILLRFRILFTLVWAAGALFFFERLRKFSFVGAALASLVFLLYTPFGIMALSYNSMGILLLLSACVLAATANTQRNAAWLLSGLFFAGAVLCCPYLLVLYVLGTLTALVLALRKKRGALRCWLLFSAGSAILLLVFCASLLSRASPSRLLEVLPELFKDPEHMHASLLERTRWYLTYLFRCHRVAPFCYAAALLATVYSKLRGKPCLGLIAVCLISALLQLAFLKETPYINYTMFPINLVGLYCAILSKKSSVRIPFYAIWLPGLVYTYCIYLSSNQTFYAISSVSTVMAVASVVMLVSFVRDLNRAELNTQFYRAAQLAVVLLMAVQFYAQTTMRYSSVFWERGGMAAQTVQAESGPERGILMTPAKYERYSGLEKDVEVLRDREDIRSVLFLSTITYLYLSAEKDMSTFSAWLSGVNEVSLERLETYFDLVPEKVPDGIYLEPEYAQYAEPFLSRGYRKEVLESGAYLLTKAAP